MLVLTRRDGEKLILEDEMSGLSIAVTVVRINGTTVKLGIDAPPRCRILREELVEDDKPQRSTFGPVPHLPGPRGRR